jgi:hypothetical protein
MGWFMSGSNQAPIENAAPETRENSADPKQPALLAGIRVLRDWKAYTRTGRVVVASVDDSAAVPCEGCRVP